MLLEFSEHLNFTIHSLSLLPGSSAFTDAQQANLGAWPDWHRVTRIADVKQVRLLVPSGGRTPCDTFNGYTNSCDFRSIRCHGSQGPHSPLQRTVMRLGERGQAL